MKTKHIQTAILGAAMVFGTMFLSGSAQAEAQVTIHSPNASVSFGDYGFRAEVRHGNPAPVYHAPPPPPPRHVCRYESHPVTRHYYDECGRRVYYTEYVKVKVCRSYHEARAYRSEYRRHARHDRGHHRGHGHKKHHKNRGHH